MMSKQLSGVSSSSTKSIKSHEKAITLPSPGMFLEKEYNRDS
jgi:hypothetical protein